MGGNSSRNTHSISGDTKSLTVLATGRVEKPRSVRIRTSNTHGSVLLGSRDSMRSGSNEATASRTGSGQNTSGSPNTEIVQNRADHEASRAFQIKYTRLLLGVSMVVLACGLGAGVFFFFRKQEVKLAKDQFTSIANRASHYAQHATQMKRGGVITMATMIGLAHPDAAEYPFVLVDGYDAISYGMLETIHSDSIGYAPIVTPEQLDAFEEFAYDAYENTLKYPNETIYQDFGPGVWGKDFLTGDRQPENRNGETYYKSSNRIYTPILQHSDGDESDGLLENLHHGQILGETIDSIIECSQGRTDTTTECGELSDLVLRSIPKNHMGGHMGHGDGHIGHQHRQLTDIMHSTDHVMHSADQDYLHSMVGMDSHEQMMDMSDEEHMAHMQMLLEQQQAEIMIKAPASFIMQPIHPVNDPDQVVGFVSSPFVWQDSLNSAFAETVSGVHCVLASTSGTVYTYYVEQGQVSLVGLGDFHESEFDDMVVIIDLINEATGLYSDSTINFYLLIYPTGKYMESFHTSNPLYGTIIIFSVMVFLTLIFCLYDWYVKREFTFKNELLEAKRNFIRFVSHEVRTPLNAVCMGLMLVREEIDVAVEEIQKEETKEYDGKSPITAKGLSYWKGTTDEILENTQTAVAVLNDLLNYDKITTGTLQLELSLLRVEDLMDHAQKEFKLPSAKKNIKVVFEDNLMAPYKRSAMQIVGDDVRLTQVLRNLMSNALKFTPKRGKIVVSISWAQELQLQYESKKKKKSTPEPDEQHEFTLKKGGQVTFAPCGYLELSVSDTGAGMTEEQMANVFDRGTQFNVNELQCGQGSGLGLYIAKGIMDQHRGSLTVSSDGLNKGTTFTMSIPLYRDPNQTKDDSSKDGSESDHFMFKAAKAKTRSTMEDLTNLRLLVVDDSDTNLKFLTRILKKRGHFCDQAKDGDVAVDMVAKSMGSSGDLESSESSNPYDAVLLDYEMPRMNGPTAAKKMREMGSDTFIVGITGNLLPEDVNYFRQQGANEVLPKPFNISDLEEILMEYGVGFREKE